MESSKPDERIAVLERDLAALKELFLSMYANHAMEHLMLDAARVETRDAMNRRLEGMNEFRSQLNDQTRTFLTRDEWKIGHEAVTSQLDKNTQGLIKIQSSSLDQEYSKIQDIRFRAIERMLYMASGGAVVIAALISFLMWWIKK